MQSDTLYHTFVFVFFFSFPISHCLHVCPHSLPFSSFYLTPSPTMITTFIAIPPDRRVREYTTIIHTTIGLFWFILRIRNFLNLRECSVRLAHSFPILLLFGCYAISITTTVNVTSVKILMCSEVKKNGKKCARTWNDLRCNR